MGWLCSRDPSFRAYEIIPLIYIYIYIYVSITAMGSMKHAYPTNSSGASRGRKFQKKKELYSKERICL